MPTSEIIHPRKLACTKCGNIGLSRCGKSGAGHQRYGCPACGFRTTAPESKMEAPDFSQSLPDNTRFIITSAQNATLIHQKFFASLQNYCKDTGASLVITPNRYRNPTRPGETPQDDSWWAKETTPYLVTGRLNIHKNLVLIADINVQPTAVRPLSGLDTITGPKSGILGHPKLEMATISTPHHKMPKIMMTTGSCTRQNYSDSKAGAKGKFHHILGATVVEIDGPRFHMRNITAGDDGAFIDLDKKYMPESVDTAPPAEALVVGDVHVGFEDPKTTKALFGKSGLCSRIKPQRLVLHDVFDGFSVNPHDRHNPFIWVGKSKYGLTGVEEELKRAADWIDTNAPNDAKVIFPASNHHDFLMRWLQSCNWKEDPENAEFYLQTALATVRSLNHTNRGIEWADPFVEWMKNNLAIRDRCVFLDERGTYSVRGIEVGQHGHLGPNGGRGSVATLSKIGVKIVFGHVHAPGIRDGATAVGVCATDMAYAKGPSSWMSAHCIINAMGKRQMIFVIDGGYCAE